MNERIQEIKAQCIFQERKGTNAFDGYTIDRFDTEKFAELIVQECIQVMQKQERIPPEYVYSKSAESHALAIKQHFGIDK